MGYFKKITESIYGEGANPMDPLGIGKCMRDIVSGGAARLSGYPPTPPSSPHATPPLPREPQLSVMIAIDGDTYGPYDSEALTELIEDGTLTPDTYVFIRGMSDWQTARLVPQVNALFGTDAEVPPPPQIPSTPPPPAAKSEPTPASVISAKLNALIDSAIADGVITDLERKVLIRNAQQEGIDIEEFCVIVDARLFERQKQLKQEEEDLRRKNARQAATPMKPKPKADRVRRCPACNAPINSASLRRCPECGYEFDNVSEGSVKHLLKKLEEADREFAEKMERRQASKGNRGRLKAFFADAFDFEADKLETEHIDRKAAMIRTHPMPETREEVLEFLYAAIPLAVDHSDDDDYEGDESLQPVWKEKCEQVVTKGRFLIKGKPEQEALRDLARKAGIYF